MGNQQLKDSFSLAAMHHEKIHWCNLKGYRRIPLISPGLLFILKAFLVSLFSGELIFGGAYYLKEF